MLLRSSSLSDFLAIQLWQFEEKVEPGADWVQQRQSLPQGSQFQVGDREGVAGNEYGAQSARPRALGCFGCFPRRCIPLQAASR